MKINSPKFNETIMASFLPSQVSQLLKPFYCPPKYGHYCGRHLDTNIKFYLKKILIGIVIIQSSHDDMISANTQQSYRKVSAETAMTL